MRGEVTIGAANIEDRAGVLRLLEEAGLPPDGLEAHWDGTLVARAGGLVVGCAAVEIYGADGLLRSVAVEPAHRGTGLGRELTAAALALARMRGVQRLYLLTETADRFFPRFGFRRVPRAGLPLSLHASAELSGACPQSATAMVTDLT